LAIQCNIITRYNIIAILVLLMSIYCDTIHFDTLQYYCRGVAEVAGGGSQ